MPTQLDPTDLDEIDELGAVMFGRGLRLRVALWVLQNGLREMFFQTEAALGVAYSQSGVAEELRRLTVLGMLTTTSSTEGRRLYYLPVAGHPGWQVFRAAQRVLAEARRHPDRVWG